MYINEIRKLLQTHSNEKKSSLYGALSDLVSNLSNSDLNSRYDYRQLFSQSRTINLLIDPLDGKIVDANKAAIDYYAYPADEFLLKYISEINTLPSDLIKREMLLAQSQQRNHFLFKHKKKTGEIRSVQVYSSPVVHNGRNLLYSVIFDVEEKIKAEHDLLRMQAAVVQSPVTIVITNLNGNIEFVNPRFTELTGYTFAEARGLNPSILKSGKTPFSVYRDLWSTITVGKVWKGQFVNKRKNGELFYESAAIAPILDNNGRISAYVAVKEDVTNLKKAEERLRDANSQLEEHNIQLNAAYEELNATNDQLNEVNKSITSERRQFLSLLNSIPEPIYVADKETYEILFSNHALNEAVGFNVVGQKCYEALRKQDRPCDYCTNEIIFNQEDAYFWENFNATLGKYYYRIDRAIKWVDGRDVRFQLAIDITKLKTVEKELLQTKEDLLKHSEMLVELNATKDKFFSIIAHDLKNPFNSILGFSNLLINKIDECDKDRIRNYAQQIYESGRTSYKLLENLLEWSRSQMGHIAFTPDNVAVYNVVDEVVVSLYSMFSAKDIKVDVDISNDTLIWADRNMLATILRNLLSNAIKFSLRNGKIVLGYRSELDFDVLFVQDFGKGMSEKIRSKLFKITEKVTTPGTEQERGTGLGLLLCNDFVNKHEGNITVKSEQGQGALFEVRFPKKQIV